MTAALVSVFLSGLILGAGLMVGHTRSIISLAIDALARADAELETLRDERDAVNYRADSARRMPDATRLPVTHLRFG